MIVLEEFCFGLFGNCFKGERILGFMCWLEDFVCDYWLSLDLILIFWFVSEGEVMIVVMLVVLVFVVFWVFVVVLVYVIFFIVIFVFCKLFGVFGFVCWNLVCRVVIWFNLWLCKC